MARLLKEKAWRNLSEGDVFRVGGIRGRRFRFCAYVTNFENGAVHIEATDTDDGSFRAFSPERRIIKDRKASRLSR